MPSFKSKIFNLLLRNRHLFQGKLKKERYDMNTSIAGFRDQCEKGASRYSKVPQGIRIEAGEVEGMRFEWLIPEGSDRRKVILYVHGGGYVSGSCNDHRGFVAKFARSAGITNLVYEYRLAPEHPFPAALEDSVRIYRWLLDSGFSAHDILVAGESAGGGLCLALLLALKDRGIPLPVAALAISPWTDLTCSSDSYRTKNRVSLAPMDSWTVFSRHYTGDHPAGDPLVSPLFGDLHGLPPLFINSGTADELYEDGEKFAEKAKSAGVDVVFRSGEGMVHCYPLLAPMFREATEAMNEIVTFVRKFLNVNN
jgi:epsilon-lactone hydrolase